MSTSANIAVAAPARSSGTRLAMLLMGGALISKVLGLVREVLIAHAIGASVIADSFRGGQTAVLLPLVFLQSESVPAILIPAYREWIEQGDAPRRFAALTVALTGMAAAIFLVVELSAPYWIDVLLGGFDDTARAMTLQFTRIMAWSMPASVLLGCLSATEIARGQSRITSLRATLVNVAVIVGVAILLLTGRPVTLAWSFSAAFNLVAAVSLGMVLHEGAIDFRKVTLADVREQLFVYMRRLKPLLLQPLAEKGQVWIERLLASSLAVGTLASLDYARTLSDCAVLLVSQPLGLAVLSAGPSNDTHAQMDRLARPVLAIAVPGSISLVFFAPELVTLVFHRGAFDAAAVASTSQALRGIAAGLWATTLGWVLIRMLNSAGRNRRASAIFALGLAANALASALLIDRLGGFALGFGEAVRGVVLLTGVAISLGCCMHLLRLLLLLLPGAGLLVALNLAVQAQVVGVLPRLAAGSVTTLLVAILSLWFLVPDVRRQLGARFRILLRRQA